MPLDDTDTDALLKEIKGEVKSTYDALDKKTADMGEVLDAIKKAVEGKAGKADTTDLDNRLKEMGGEVKKLAVLADTLDKKLARPGGDTSARALTLGQRVAQSEGAKSWAANRGGRFAFEAKAVITGDLAVGSQTLTAGVPRQQSELVRMPERTLTVRDLLTVGRTTSNMIEYPRQNLRTLNAAPVAENALKPESTFDLTLETAPVRTIAHWFQVSKQLLDDLAMLETYLDQDLRYGLALTEEAQLLTGDGTGSNILGLMPQATLFPASVATSGIPGGTAAQRVDVIRWAKLLVRQALYPATAVVLNPEDWARIEMLKDADGRYIYSAFASGAEQRLWGLRVVESDAITAGQFLVGAFAMGAHLWDREDANVVLSTEDRDNFVKNMVTIRGEERIALTVERPAAFVRGSFTLAA